MIPPTHVIDPDGEVIIVLRNADSPFAEISQRGSMDEDNDILSALHHQTHANKRRKKSDKEKEKKSTRQQPDTPTPIREAPPEEAPTNELSAGEVPASEPPGNEFSSDKTPADEVPAQYFTTESPGQNCFHIQVSAKHLILASPVFKRMLPGGWKESTEYLQKGSVEVNVEGWDIEALLLVLRLIHSQFYKIPKELTVEMLAKVAVIIRYYGCEEASWGWTDRWIRKLKEKNPSTTSRGLLLRVWIAWFLRMPEEFKKATSIVISRTDGLIDGRSLPISGSVINSMNQSRINGMRKLISLIHQTRNAFLEGTRGCSFQCRSIMYGGLSLQMKSNNLLSPNPMTPFTNLNYSDLVLKIRRFETPKHAAMTGIISSCCRDAQFVNVFPKLNDSLEGLQIENFTR